MRRRRARRANRPRAAGNRGTKLVSESVGSDMITSLGIGADQQSGMVLYNMPLSPFHLQNTRLAAESVLWARWRPVSLVLRWTGAGALTVFGNLVVGWSGDPSERLAQGSTLSNVTKVAAMRPSATCKVVADGRMVIPVDTARKWYNCESQSKEDVAHGSLCVVVGSRIGGFTGEIGLNLSLDWKVQFEGPEIPMAAGPSPPTKEIRPDSGWVGPFFTTSDSSYDATVLTIKEHPGGDMVPFSGAVAGSIYKLGSVDLDYYNSAGQAVTVSYASRAYKFATPGLVFHSTFADATAYQSTGDTNKCFKYVSAGPWSAQADIYFDLVTSAQQVRRDNVEARMEVLEEMMRELLRRRTPPPPSFTNDSEEDFEQRD